MLFRSAPPSPAQFAFLLLLLSCSLAHIWEVTHFILKLTFKTLPQLRPGTTEKKKKDKIGSIPHTLHLDKFQVGHISNVKI